MWKEHYRIGEVQIDEQHKQLMMATEELLAAIKDPGQDTKQQCMQTVNYLKDYTVVHFNTEEMFQAKIGFSDRVRHKQLHDDFIVRLRELDFALIRSDYAAKEVENLARMLTSWWIYHIMKEDRKMLAEMPDTPDTPKKK